MAGLSRASALAQGVKEIDHTDGEFDRCLGKYPASRACLRAAGFRRMRGWYEYAADLVFDYRQAEEQMMALLDHVVPRCSLVPT